MKRIGVALALAGFVLVSACGGDESGSTTTVREAAPTTQAPASTEAPRPTEAPSTTAATADPAALGEQIGEVYVAAYGDVVALLADRPDPATAAEELAALKEQYIQELVAYGWEREALDSAGRATVDARISIAVNGIPSETFAEYQQVVDDYRSDSEVADLILSFNIIGQYANFDLLREQEPEEAARLGIG